MIDRFNFYDIYGYLLPGATMLALLWLPFGIVSRKWPDAQIADAIFILVFSYVVGHLLQTLATTTLPSKVKDKSGNLRTPSDIVLDSDDSRLSPQLKSKLETYARGEFGIDLEIHSATPPSEQISAKRTDVFFLCRGVLIRQKIAGYTEQFEGLYAMMRGLSLAFFLGTAYLAGWGCSEHSPTLVGNFPLSTFIFSLGCIGVFGSGLLALRRGPFAPKRVSTDRWLWRFLSVALFGIGMGLAIGKDPSPNLTWAATLASAVAGARCYSSYRIFAMHFATAVWRDFAGFKCAPLVPSK